MANSRRFFIDYMGIMLFVRLPFVGTHRMRPPVALADTRGVSLQDYRTTNFCVSPAKVIKYMP